MEQEKKKTGKSTGRKKKPVEAVRSICYSVRFTESENNDLLSIAETLGLSVAELLRSKGLRTKNQVVNGVNLIASLDKIGAELGRSGNNINQLAKHANTLNKMGKVDQAVMTRFNILFSDYIIAKREIQIALRKIIREVRG